MMVLHAMVDGQSQGRVASWQQRVPELHQRCNSSSDRTRATPAITRCNSPTVNAAGDKHHSKHVPWCITLNDEAETAKGKQQGLDVALGHSAAASLMAGPQPVNVALYASVQSAVPAPVYSVVL